MSYPGGYDSIMALEASYNERLRTTLAGVHSLLSKVETVCQLTTLLSKDTNANPQMEESTI